MKKNLHTVEMPNLKRISLTIMKENNFYVEDSFPFKSFPLINLKEEVFSGVISHGHLKFPASFKWAN